MDELNYLKVLHELWKTKCIGVFEIKKFLFFKNLKLTTITNGKIEATCFEGKTKYTSPAT